MQKENGDKDKKIKTTDHHRRQVTYQGKMAFAISHEKSVTVSHCYKKPFDKSNLRKKGTLWLTV